jgi:hypothetical protein
MVWFCLALIRSTSAALAQGGPWVFHASAYLAATRSMLGDWPPTVMGNLGRTGPGAVDTSRTHKLALIAERFAAGPENAVHNRDVVGEPGHPFARCPGLATDAVVIPAEHAGADAQFEPASGKVIQAHRLLCQLRGRAQDLVGDHRPHVDALRLHGGRGEHRPAVEPRPASIAEISAVIREEYLIEPELFQPRDPIDELGETVIRVEHHPEPGSW